MSPLDILCNRCHGSSEFNPKESSGTVVRSYKSVAPFCDVFYFDCRYNPILSAVYHFTETVVPFIANHLSFLDCDKRGCLECRTAQLIDELDVLRRMGVGVTCLEGHELYNASVDTLRSGGVLYVPADLYVMPGYGNYRESHLGHWFLLTDWGDSDGFVVAIEAEDKESVNASELQLPISLLSDAYLSWIEFRGHGDARKYFATDWKGELSAISALATENVLSNSEAVDGFLKLVRMHYDQMEHGLHVAATSCEELASEVARSDGFDWMKLARNLKRVFRCRRTEVYRLRTLFGSDDEAAEFIERSAAILQRIIYSTLHTALASPGGREADVFVRCTKEVVALERQALSCMMSRL